MRVLSADEVHRSLEDAEWLGRERELLARAKSGDRAAFAEIYEAFARALYARVLMPRLVVVQGKSKGKSVDVDTAAVIGRGETAQLQIGDSHASREHCKVFQQGGTWMVSDLNPTEFRAFVGEVRQLEGTR